MPVQEFPVGLDGGHHARQHVLAAELALDFRPDARPGAGGELAQQLAVEAGVQSQAFGDGQDDLPVRDGKADVFGHVDSRQQGTFLVARGAGAALLAGKGHKHFVVAVGAADAGEALAQVAAGEKSPHGALDDRPPEAVLGLITLVVDLLEGLEVPIQQAPQFGCLRVAWAVERQRLDTRRCHDRKGNGSVIVYSISLERKYTFCQVGGTGTS